MRALSQIRIETYGHDNRAINRHTDRIFNDGKGNLFMLSKTPACFEAYGPYRQHHEGHLPRLPVRGKKYWGAGSSWRRAMVEFRRAVESCGHG